MFVESKFVKTGRVLCMLQGALLFVYLLLCLSVFTQTLEPVYMVTALLGILCQAWCLTSSVSDYNAYIKQIADLIDIDVKFVAREETVRVYTDKKYYTLHGVNQVYNKDIDTPTYYVDSNLLCIPYSIDIHTSRS